MNNGEYEATLEMSQFKDMWYKIFLFCLATSVFIHCVAALIAFRALRKHKTGRFFPVVLIITGFLFPMTGGVITSAVIAGVYNTASFKMANYTAFLWGGGQALVGLVMAFTRILATL